MKIALSSGHGKYIRGARGSPVPPQLDEVDEARRVVARVAEMLKKTNVGIVTFNDDTSHSQNENLNTIVAWHNKQTRDYDVSCHFNAFDHTAHGTEVLYVSQQSLAKKVCDAIVGAGGFTNRGAKYNGNLAFLNGTNKPAILLEVCFCDNTADSNKYNDKFDAICEAIAESIGGENVPDDVQPTPPEPEPPPAELVVSVAITAPPGVIVNVMQSVSGAAPQDVSALQKIPSES
jgi:N-acetylmuramoyl-L-alanine amidase